MLGHRIFSLLVCWILYAIVRGEETADDKEFLQRKTNDILSQLNHFETIIPQLVDNMGHFISYDVTHSSALRHTNLEHSRMKRWTRRGLVKSSQNPNVYLDGSDQIGRSSIFYKLSAYGREFHFNLTLNTQLLTKDFSVELWGDVNSTRGSADVWDCHYVGTSVKEHAFDAAISNCNGLGLQYCKMPRTSEEVYKWNSAKGKRR